MPSTKFGKGSKMYNVSAPKNPAGNMTDQKSKPSSDRPHLARGKRTRARGRY